MFDDRHGERGGHSGANGRDNQHPPAEVRWPSVGDVLAWRLKTV